MTVSELLQRSRAAHEESKPRKDRARNMDSLRKAAELRLEAVALDPGMTDPSWNEDRANHYYLLGFYDEKRVLPDIPAPPAPPAPPIPAAFASLTECLDILRGDYDIAELEAGTIDSRGVPGVYARAMVALQGLPNG